MFERAVDRVRAAIDALDANLTPDELRVLLAARDRLDERITAAVDHFDRRNDHEPDGATSTAAWLTWQARIARPDADRLVRMARALRALPATAAAWADQRLSTAQARTITTAATHHAALLAQHETALIAAVAPLSAADTATALHHWAARADAATDRPGDPDDSGSLALAPLPDGTWHLTANPTAAQGDTLAAAARLFGPDDPATPPGQRRMHGLVNACAFALAHRDTPKPARHRPHVDWHVTPHPSQAPLAITDAGTTLDTATTAAGLCDADIQRVVWDADGHLLDYGRTTRVVPNALRRAVTTRDRHCRYPGCDRPASWADIHHLTPWYDGGHTSLDNTVLLCRHHHTVLHRPGWHAKLHPDATLEVTTPTGTTHTSHPPPRC